MNFMCSSALLFSHIPLGKCTFPSLAGGGAEGEGAGLGALSFSCSVLVGSSVMMEVSGAQDSPEWNECILLLRGRVREKWILVLL